MKRGCNVNAVDGLGQSALHFVANGTHSHCIKMVDKIMKNGKYNPGQQNSYKKDLYDFKQQSKTTYRERTFIIGGRHS